jgi:hypothetical protein
MMTSEVRTIRQKMDKPTSEALSQPREVRIVVEAVGNSIHYFLMSLKGSGKQAPTFIIALFMESDGAGKIYGAFIQERQKLSLSAILPVTT